MNETQPQLERLPVLRELRFGVEDTATGLVSGAFKLVARGQTDDLYIMQRDVGHRFKASRHSGGRWFLQPTRQVGGAQPPLSRSWTEPVPEPDGRVEIARIVMPRTVAKQAADTEHPSTSLVQLDDAHPAVVFRLWRVPAGIWLRTEPGLRVLGGVVLPESKSYGVIIAYWLDRVPQLPEHFRLAPEHANDLRSGETTPARSLTFWGIIDDRLVIMDLPSASLGADENSEA